MRVATNTEDKIRRSALRLFVENGFACPTSAITKDAGVSQGILFHYFPTKNDLILDLYAVVLKRYFEEATTSFAKHAESIEEYESMLRTSWLRQVDWCLEHWMEFCYMRAFEESQFLSLYISDEREELRDVGDFLHEQTRRGVEMGATRDIDADFLTQVGNSMTAATARYLHARPEKRDDEAFMEQAWLAYRALGRSE